MPEQLRAHAAQWVHEYADALYGYAWQRVRNEDIAKDLVQETMLAAWRNMDRYDATQPLKGWLFAILKNKLIDHYRKSAAGLAGRTDQLADEVGFFDEADHWAGGFYPQDWSTRADKQLNTREFYKILHACKNRLKELQAAVFSMKYLDDMDSEEICRELGISSNNYWVLMHRAKVQLRACLEKNWVMQ